MRDTSCVYLRFLHQLQGLPQVTNQISDDGNTSLNCLRALAGVEESVMIREHWPDLIQVQKQTIPGLETRLTRFTELWSLHIYVIASYNQLFAYFEIFLNSGDQADAREAFKLALALACITGHCGHIVAGDIRRGEFFIWVIMAYLVDYPQDFESALQAVAEFGTSMVTFLLDAHGRKTLEDFHRHTRSSQHPTLPYPIFLFHVVSAVISDSVRGDQEAALVTILQSFEITSTVIDDLKDYTNNSNIQEYYCLCMVLHYIYYARLIRSNDTSDLYDSLQYRLSADAIFPQPEDSEFRLLDLVFLSKFLFRTDGACGDKVYLHFLHCLERSNIFAPPERETSLAVTYNTVPLMSPLDGELDCTTQAGKLLLLFWTTKGYDRISLGQVASLLELVTQRSSITDEERQEAHWWLSFVRLNPDPHALDPQDILLEVEVTGMPEVTVPWSQRAIKFVVSQWTHAAKEGNLLRLAELLPLLQVTLANLDTNHEGFEYCTALESVSALLSERINELDTGRAQDTRRILMSFFEDEHTTSLKELRAKATSTEESSFSRLRFAREWAQRSFKEALPESMDAFEQYALLLQDNIHIGTTADHKYQILASEEWVRHWSGTAVTAVVRHGGPDRLSLAVEFLEQSRSVTYRHLFQLRQGNNQLSETYPDLAKRWLCISSRIQDEFQIRTRNIHEMNAKALEVYEYITTRSLEDSHHKLLNEIREKPGFECFLSPLKYDELTKVADEGPVIMLSSDPQTELSHALIILPGCGQPVYFQLPKEASFSGVSEKCDYLARLVAGDEQLVRRGWRMDTGPSDKESLQFRYILEWLWVHVVHPVFDTLRAVGYTSGRVWWCPSGDFTLLPLHAAAMLNPHHSIISSYTPSLETLIDTRRRGPASEDTMMPRRLAAIGLESCPGRKELQPLYAVGDELGIFFEDNGKNYGTIERMKLEGPDAQVGSVLNVMKTSHIVHLACHGIQDSFDPLNSHLILYDNELSLRALLNESLPFAEFAFLSACQTATGHRELANESAHLAGGFIAAGFKGVVGTTWSIADEDAPRVVREVYLDMITREGGFDVRKAAEGLHRAVQGMIKQGLPPRRWAPFIHVGI